MAAGIDALLSDLGDRPDNIEATVESWWTFLPFPELGNATIAQAWLDGNVEGVDRIAKLPEVKRTRP